MNLKQSEKICPLCGKDNNCQNGQKECWCSTAKFPKHILDMVPADKKRQSCICKSCFEKYSK